ncbi:TIGR04282 family arsenosugar biosynthesis glycosyltransferase [Geobacter sp. SVR]|uniref:TIGR04282 family arsenosugar biosynthesis glycosyltransferase n=1 Tax=Geobacter sp. SVR TaxID=2495594 RepID=UPI0015674B4D|nr:TIGR04282 family arsenosugar biosynthesis glycosyltransferase [Geobacter sp. SVR]
MDTNKGLIIFAREPVPGRVKTRLARQVGEQAAADLYAEMLADVVALAASLEDVRPVVFWALENPDVSCPEFSGMGSARQQGACLGERMSDAFERTFADGSELCCIIGSDSPDLPADYVRQAFDVLEQGRADVVFGPSEDGGYYLLGMSRLWPELFEGISWGGPQVLEVSLERARKQGLRAVLLPTWYDIDTAADLERLAQSPDAVACRTGRMLLGSDFIVQAGQACRF